MADTQELQRLALVVNLMDTDDCVADLRRLNRYHVVGLYEGFYNFRHQHCPHLVIFIIEYLDSI